MTIDILHGEPGDLIDLEDLHDLHKAVLAIEPWMERHAEVLDYVYRGRVARALALRASVEDLRTLHDHLRRTIAILRTKDHLDSSWEGRWRGYAAVIDARLGALATQDRGAVLDRLHVRRVLELVTADMHGVPQSKIGDDLKVRKANLTRVLSMMEDHDLVERRRVGREKLVFLGRAAPEREDAFAAGGGFDMRQLTDNVKSLRKRVGS